MLSFQNVRNTNDLSTWFLINYEDTIGPLAITTLIMGVKQASIEGHLAQPFL